MATPDIAAMRRDYRLAGLEEESTGNDPLSFFQKWFDEAVNAHLDEANSMTLATADADGQPHARIVLLKGLQDGGFVFFTNYESDKGRQLEANHRAALLFFWKELERQVRIEGRVQRLDKESSDAYYHSRPVASQIGAWASPQSQVIPNRSFLEQRVSEVTATFQEKIIQRPNFWGGFLLLPESIEFWQGRPSRLHDRILFSKDNNGWHKQRLAP